MAGEIEARLRALNIALPELAAPIANYVPFLHLGNLLFISGQLPLRDGKVTVAGKLGAGVDLAQGEEAARLCALTAMETAQGFAIVLGLACAACGYVLERAQSFSKRVTTRVGINTA